MLSAYGDGKVFGEPYGQSPYRVVWLHGWARQGHDFASSAIGLAALGISSVALDLPGFGSSPAPTVAGGARSYAQMIVPVLREIADEPLVLVGHSRGGCIATVIAATNPELVKSLVITGSPLVRREVTSKSPLRYRLTRSMHAKGLVSPQKMESARRRHGSSDYRNASGIMRDVFVMMVNESYESELARVQAPIYMVWGQDDHEVPVEVAKKAGVFIKSPHSLRVLDEVGHLVPLEAPSDLVQTVLEALA
ncbi:MAG: alpha/beta hydrolase [Acidimicrobiales bacterium]|jgi:pimeloyl-ACP methyl ester carboxylesterase